jgi:hypothetical protein
MGTEKKLAYSLVHLIEIIKNYDESLALMYNGEIRSIMQKGVDLELKKIITEVNNNILEIKKEQQGYTKVELKNYIEQEFKNLDRGIVATPETREHLESFAKANNGSMDLVLMQMAINYGYKIALENLNEQFKNK